LLGLLDDFDLLALPFFAGFAFFLLAIGV
jgi:hypothetical protein